MMRNRQQAAGKSRSMNGQLAVLDTVASVVWELEDKTCNEPYRLASTMTPIASPLRGWLARAVVHGIETGKHWTVVDMNELWQSTGASIPTDTSLAITFNACKQWHSHSMHAEQWRCFQNQDIIALSTLILCIHACMFCIQVHFNTTKALGLPKLTIFFVTWKESFHWGLSDHT